MQETPVREVIRALLTLTPERVAEVYDFILFLKDRYGQSLDVSDVWIEEDIHDLTAASLIYATETLWPGEDADGSAG